MKSMIAFAVTVLLACLLTGAPAAYATDIYVTKFDDGSIWKVDTVLGIPHLFAPGVSGTDNATHLAYGPDGNFYETCESADDVVKFNGQTGAYMGVVADATSGLSGVQNIAFGPDGNLYVASCSNDRILKYNTAGTFLGRFSAIGALSQPTSIAFGKDGNAYVSSYSQPFLTCLNGMTGAALGTVGNWNSYDDRGGHELLTGPDGDLFVHSWNGEYLKIDRTTGQYAGVFATNHSYFYPLGAGFADGYFYATNFTNGQSNGGLLLFNEQTGAYLETVFSAESYFRPSGLAVVPEPASLAILALGALGVVRRGTRRTR